MSIFGGGKKTSQNSSTTDGGTSKVSLKKGDRNYPAPVKDPVSESDMIHRTPSENDYEND